MPRDQLSLELRIMSALLFRADVSNLKAQKLSLINPVLPLPISLPQTKPEPEIR